MSRNYYSEVIQKYILTLLPPTHSSTPRKNSILKMQTHFWDLLKMHFTLCIIKLKIKASRNVRCRKDANVSKVFFVVVFFLISICEKKRNIDLLFLMCSLVDSYMCPDRGSKQQTVNQKNALTN